MFIIGNKIIELKETKSTNGFASSLLLQDKQPEGTIVLAEYQTNGKGQGANVWQSTKGENILMSVILYPDFLPISRQFYLSKITALSIIKSIKSISGINCKIKWPNDIFIKNKKTGGILIQNSIRGMAIKNSVLGIGLNVNQKEFPHDLPCATSMSLETGKNFDIHELIYLLTKNMDEYYLRLRGGDFEGIKQEFVSNLFGYNEQLQFQDENSKLFTARIISVKDNGELLLNINGKIKAFAHGQIALTHINHGFSQ